MRYFSTNASQASSLFAVEAYSFWNASSRP
jgi:hypothetical protein